MTLIVQKFGGTSVATDYARQSLLTQVNRCRNEGNDVVIVVSAMGRSGEPYATDTLISLLEEINTNVSPRKKDLMLSCGEIISCSLISHLLETNNIPSEPLTGSQAGIITTNTFSNSEIISIDTTKIEKYLKEGKVVVIAGFQGTTIEGEITTLGRGGSDISAVCIGGYLNADRVDIYTDVLGIAKIDPRIVPTAPYMPTIMYDDMFKLADHGAKIVHPRAVKIAQELGMPVRVRSTFSEYLGTLITGEVTKYDHKIVGFALEKNMMYSEVFIVFDIAYKDEIKDYIQDFIESSDIIPKDVIWGNGDVSLLFSTVNIVEIARNLYSYLHE